MAIIGVVSFFAFVFFVFASASSKLRQRVSPKLTVKKSLLFVLISFIIFLTVFSMDETTNNNDIETTAVSPTKEVIATKDSEVMSTSTQKPTSDPTPTPTPTPTPEPTTKETVAQKNALRKAIDYLNYTSFSRQGLIEQLEYEGFETADAKYAVDNIAVDWDEQAFLKAKDYLDYTAFSLIGLIEQLESEGFTKDQAEYGANEAFK